MCKVTNKGYSKCLIFLLPVYFLFGCNQKKESSLIEHSFYYWKSNLNLSQFEKQQLRNLKVKTLYIKFFDVDWNTQKQSALPIAKLTLNEKSLEDLRNSTYTKTFKFSVIPTIFITNETFIHIETTNIPKLVTDIQNLITSTISSNAFDEIGGIQFDCDWTESTKEKYFLFLTTFKQNYSNTAMEISATIRLHQIKFITKTGVPPVNKGMLMCYNMGNLKNPDTHNSILETSELKKYIGRLNHYPLPLDIALPLFEWNVLFRNNIYNGILRDFSAEVFKESFVLKKQHTYTLLKDTILQGYELKKDDLIRNEQSHYSEIIKSIGALKPELKNTPRRVSLYHLDSLILRKYTTHELETIYNSFY